MKPGCKVLLPLLFVAALVGCGDQKENPSAAQAASAPEKKPETVPVPASKPAAETISDVLSITAPLVVEHQVDVTAQRDGIIATISVDTGARVGTSTVLAQLDDRQ